MQCYLPPLSKIFLPARPKSSAAGEKYELLLKTSAKILPRISTATRCQNRPFLNRTFGQLATQGHHAAHQKHLPLRNLSKIHIYLSSFLVRAPTCSVDCWDCSTLQLETRHQSFLGPQQTVS